ncbi:hypothetical protein [Streptomyces sp. NPDC008121]|uniref:hypothetical protein n=1 Tax=Streptomyces sp. NPDC008121 TaxID=3364809 RepID=UPI0036F00DEA
MRAVHVASAALLVTLAVPLGAVAALADEGTGNDITSFAFAVTPSTVAPGGTVTLTSEGCEVPFVTAESGVFDTVTLDEGRTGTATVDAEAKVGAAYDVTFDCEGERGTTSLTIAAPAGGPTTGGHTAGGPTPDTSAPDAPTPDAPAPDDPALDVPAPEAPTAGGHVPAGQATGGHPTQGGSTGGQVAGAHPSGSTGSHPAGAAADHGVRAGFGGADGRLDTAEVVAGGVLIAGALGGAAWLTLRRRRADGPA